MADENFDVYEGLSWSDRARYGVYGVALDCADTLGNKNRFIDAIHKAALAGVLRCRHRRFEHALDFGCGGGRLMPLLAAHAAATYGVDRTPECIAMARAAKIVPDDHLLLWRAGPVPFPDDFFDLVLSAYVLLRTAVLDAAMPELARVTRAGGTAILLEQLANSRGLTPDRYQEAFAHHGFVLERRQIVRRSAGSRWMRLASTGRRPAWLTAAAARVEIAAASRVRFSPSSAGYYDCLFVLKRAA